MFLLHPIRTLRRIVVFLFLLVVVAGVALNHQAHQGGNAGKFCTTAADYAARSYAGGTSGTGQKVAGFAVDMALSLGSTAANFVSDDKPGLATNLRRSMDRIRASRDLANNTEQTVAQMHKHRAEVAAALTSLGKACSSAAAALQTASK